VEVEILISPYAQALFNSLGQPPANRKVKSSLNEFKLKMIDFSLEVGEAEKKHKLWAQLILVK
jgi:hypothetical protein